MSTRNEIRAALSANGPSTATELLGHCPSAGGDRARVLTSLQALRTETKVKAVGLEEGEPVYDLLNWPADDGPRLRVPGSAPQKPTPNAATERAPDRAPTPVTTPSPAQPAASPEEPMPLKDTIVAALKAHGPMSLIDLRKHTKVVAITGSLAKMMKAGLIEKSGPGAGVYGLAVKGAPPQQRKAKKKRAAPKARAKKDEASDALTGTVRDLKRRREALMADVSKLDRAIEAVEALAA